MRPMNPEVKKTWVEALRSGLFKQGKSQLSHKVDGGHTHCCLGVLEELFCTAHGRRFTPLQRGYGVHTKRTAKWSGLSRNDDDEGQTFHYKTRDRGSLLKHDTPAYEHLAEMNDMGKGFKAIATWIEKHL